MEAIFVLIPAYRDHEILRTVQDLFLTASHPERVFAGICWQNFLEGGEGRLDFPGFEDNIRVINTEASDSEGMGWAKRQAQSLYRGEEYVLGIDSHSQFSQDWDEVLIEQLQGCPGDKSVLSATPHPYHDDDEKLTEADPAFVYPAKFNEYGFLKLAVARFAQTPVEPLRVPFLVTRFVFGPAAFIKEVPADPHVYFNEEDITLSVRAWSHGWDVYQPVKIPVWHLYNTDGSKRPLHWNDHENWQKFQQRSRLCYQAIMKNEQKYFSGQRAIYGPGSARDISSFQDFAGVDLVEHAIQTELDEACFAHSIEPYRANARGLWQANSRPGTPQALSPANGGSVERVIVVDSGQHPQILPPRSGNIRQSLPVESSVKSAEQPRFVDAPVGIMMVENYFSAEQCQNWRTYADEKLGTNLQVVDHGKSSARETRSKPSTGRITEKVPLDDIRDEVTREFVRIYASVLSDFYHVEFEWFERPQMLRYGAGGLYNRHADGDHWLSDEKRWIRTHDRDYSVLLYLNDDYEGGELYFPRLDFRFRPRRGMLVAFPSNYRYEHAAEETTGGQRYALVSWAAILGSQRVKEKAPFGSVFLNDAQG